MRLRARVVPVSTLTADDVDQMWRVFERYYENVDRARFQRDLIAKDDVIVLREPDGTLRGFSTLKNLTVEHEGHQHRAVFSGDTVVEREFWGDRSLGIAFLLYLARKRLAHPLSPLWWILITKGYKTYLLMANNFREFWPRHDQPTPATSAALIDALATHLFPDDWRRDLGVVRFSTPMGQVRGGVAEITEDLRRSSAHAAFFEFANPGWRAGDELFCVARMDWTMPITYAFKAGRLKWRRP